MRKPMSDKSAIAILIGFSVFLMFISWGMAKVAPAAKPPLKEKEFHIDKANITRIVDNEAGVICYVIPKEFCDGDCAYSPAITCVKMEQ